MILDLSIENFGPYRERSVLSMEAASYKDLPGNVIEAPNVRRGLLSSVLIYGANASGKTCVIEALRALQRIIDEPRMTGERVPGYNPFRPDAGTRYAPVRLGIRLILDSVTYDYSVAYSADSIVEESLYRYPNGRRACVFERKDGTFSNCSKQLVERTTPASSYLTVAACFNDPVCSMVRKGIMDIIVLRSDDLDGMIRRTCIYIIDHPERRASVIEALRKADVSIRDITVQGIFNGAFSAEGDSSDDMLGYPDVIVKHDNEKYTDDDTGLLFDLDAESSGTRNLFGLMGPLLQALTEGRTIVIDELGSHLHPLIVRWVISQFTAENNPNHAQMIANTHDVEQMDVRELLRRDQIWFVERNRQSGESVLYSLADIKGSRWSDPVRRQYLDGRYDAVSEPSTIGVMQDVRTRCPAQLPSLAEHQRPSDDHRGWGDREEVLRLVQIENERNTRDSESSRRERWRAYREHMQPYLQERASGPLQRGPLGHRDRSRLQLFEIGPGQPHRAL